MFLFVFQYVSPSYFVIHTLLVIMVITIITLLCRTDPGYVAKDPSLNFLGLLETGHLDKVCAICEIALTSRIKHCRFCNKWVENYDHHCPWINNWVGLKNHNLFYIFLVTLFSFLIYNIAFSVVNVKDWDDKAMEKSSFIEIKFLKKAFNHEWVYRIFLITNIMLR